MESDSLLCIVCSEMCHEEEEEEETDYILHTDASAFSGTPSTYPDHSYPLGHDLSYNAAENKCSPGTFIGDNPAEDCIVVGEYKKSVRGTRKKYVEPTPSFAPELSARTRRMINARVQGTTELPSVEDRLLHSLKLKEAREKSLVHEYERNQLDTMKSVPTINKRSQQLTGRQPVVERLYRNASLRFTDPSRSRTVTSSNSPVDDMYDTESFEYEFKPAINERSKNMHRTIQNMFQWANEKQKRLDAQRDLKQKVESFTTGHPEINLVSQKIVKNLRECEQHRPNVKALESSMVQNLIESLSHPPDCGRKHSQCFRAETKVEQKCSRSPSITQREAHELYDRLYRENVEKENRRTLLIHDHQDPEATFHPRINSRSRDVSLSRSQKNVFDHLYESSKNVSKPYEGESFPFQPKLNPVSAKLVRKSRQNAMDSFPWYSDYWSKETDLQLKFHKHDSLLLQK